MDFPALYSEVWCCVDTALKVVVETTWIMLQGHLTEK